MLYGTLYFSDSMAKPKKLDSRSTDWQYPIPVAESHWELSDTRSVRNCYRSKRVDIRPIITGTGSANCINANIFIHNAAEISQGAVRMYLWRAAPVYPPNVNHDIQPLNTGSEELVELVCNTRTVTKGIAIGTITVDAIFSEFQVVVMQPCTGVSVYFSPAGIVRGPTVGPAVQTF